MMAGNVEGDWRFGPHRLGLSGWMMGRGWRERGRAGRGALHLATARGVECQERRARDAGGGSEAELRERSDGRAGGGFNPGGVEPADVGGANARLGVFELRRERESDGK